ncbi:reverse transcriptase domain-containing protein [Salinicoccus roseus]|uniref:reverse transcriptase domain-containing protein n=1 Tax=Salinicoccus roseus TaxID=45670 RepID=UPI001EF495F4|nr:reverse transcriptase domain-containing protein [Salinicoccus roseus]MCG7331857.1 hypothetical protein [Salinicoccus roseus]
MNSKFESYFSYEKLKDVSERYIHSTSALGIDKMTYEYFQENQKPIFYNIENKVLNDNFKFTPFKEKLILKSRNNFPRLISIPTLRDKLVLKTLHLYLKDSFLTIEQPLPQECIVKLKKDLPKFDMFLKLDIRNFYGNIKHGILKRELEDHEIDKKAFHLINSAITTKTVSENAPREEEIITKGVPQGLSISNILANIYLNKIDEEYKGKKDILYIRYVDDIVILCTKENFEQTFKEIKYKLEAIYNLELNSAKEKKGKIKDGFDFLGYAVIGTEEKIKFTVKEENKKKFEDSIVKIFTQYKYSPKMGKEQFIFALNNKITGSISKRINGDHSKEYRYGWLFYFSQMNDTKFLYHLDWFINKLIDDFKEKYPQKFENIDKNKIKSFKRAFYEIKYNVNETEYIHKPDLRTLEEKKNLLRSTFNIPEERLKNNDNVVRKLYYKLVYKPILNYEKDIKFNIS